MTNHSNKILKKTFLGLCSIYLSVAIAEGAEVERFTPDDYIAAKAVFLHPQTVGSIDAAAIPTLVIGRGNAQGVVAGKVTHPLLQSVSNWFFLDPIPQHHNTPQTPDSIVSKWPPTSDLEAVFTEKFNHVLFDFGVTHYMGDTGEIGTLLRTRWEEIMSVKGDRTKEDFEYPYQYEDYVRATYPEKTTPIHDKCQSCLRAVEDAQHSVLEQGIQSAFSCLKSGGHLFVPIEERLPYLDAAKIMEILEISATQIVTESWTSPDGEWTSDSPLLPEIKKGDGCSADTWKWFVISKLGSVAEEE